MNSHHSRRALLSYKQRSRVTVRVFFFFIESAQSYKKCINLLHTALNRLHGESKLLLRDNDVRKRKLIIYFDRLINSARFIYNKVSKGVSSSIIDES